MSIQEQMAGYAAHLNANTPTDSKGKPVTEIAIFKLQPSFEKDHAAVSAEFNAQIVTNCKPNAPHAKGIRKIAWGFSIDDPSVFVWLLDWDKIENHWDFWLTEAFPPVMGAINELFEAGRPLVRHYDFGGAGMLSEEVEFARILVWDDGEDGKLQERAKVFGNGERNVGDSREGYAVDLDEATWWCSLLGYESEEAATSAVVTLGSNAPSHVYQLNYHA